MNNQKSKVLKKDDSVQKSEIQKKPQEIEMPGYGDAIRIGRELTEMQKKYPDKNPNEIAKLVELQNKFKKQLTEINSKQEETDQIPLKNNVISIIREKVYPSVSNNGVSSFQIDLQNFRSGIVILTCPN